MSSEISIHDGIISSIYFIRGRKVMLDNDTAILYGIDTKVLKQAVRRNLSRFPEDFMFELTKAEYKTLRSQNVTLKKGQHSKYLPYASTEQGIAMLSGVLRSEKAVQVNIEIMRAFIKMRSAIQSYKQLEDKINELEKKYDERFSSIFEVLKQLIRKESSPRKKIGYKIEGAD